MSQERRTSEELVDAPSVGSKLLVAALMNGSPAPSTGDRNVILEQQLRLNQQERLIGHLESALSSHKQIVATLAADLGTTRQRLASIQQQKDLLAEEVSFMSALVVSELPDQLTRPVQQSTVHLPPHELNSEGQLDDESNFSGRFHPESTATSISPLDNDMTVTCEEGEYYDDSSYEGESPQVHGAPQRRLHPDSPSNKKAKTLQRRQSFLLPPSLGLHPSQRHHNLRDLLLPFESDIKNGTVPSVIFVKNQKKRSCGNNVHQPSFTIKRQASESQLERQGMFSAMMEKVDSLITSQKKRSRLQSGTTQHNLGADEFWGRGVHTPAAASSKKQRCSNSI